MRSIEGQRAKLGKSRNSSAAFQREARLNPLGVITLGVTQLPVAAITLSGQPKVDEPLNRNWPRFAALRDSCQ
jgi:hypothetical protein